MNAVVSDAANLLRDWARYYAQIGLRVFPLPPGLKAPQKGDLGITSATTDLTRIDAWWTAQPDANIGASGAFRIDVDQKHNGMANWVALQEKHGAAPTRTARTPSGGLHLWFHTDRKYGNSEGSLPDGINVRGHDTGYCVMPPSWTREILGKQCEGRYEWLDVHAPIAPAPQWVLDLIGTPPVCEETRTPILIEATDQQISDLRSALLSPGMLSDWDQWVSNGLALLSLGDIGRELWKEYSAAQIEATNRQIGDDNAESFWERHGRTKPKSDFLSIFKRASARGWLNPMHHDPTRFGFGKGPAPTGILAVPPPPPSSIPMGTMPPSNEWPEPVNFFAGKMEAPAFDGSEFPPELAAYPLLHARQTGFDPNMGLNAALTIAAAAIPEYIQVCADSESNFFAQARLWHLTIAGPGVGKSPVQRELLKPLWDLHIELLRQWQATMDARDEDDPSPPPPQPRVIVADVTLEKLSDVLEENPRGVLLATDEFSAWLGSLDQYKNGGVPGRDRGEWLRLFDGGPHQIERVTRGSKFIPNWGASILTASTPSQMQAFSRNLPEDGLIQRFLVVLARRRQPRQDKPAPADMHAACAAYGRLIRRLWNLRPMTHGGIVQMAPDAKERFNAWSDENDVLTAAFGEVEPALAGHVAKYPTFALRIALTFHCVRVAARTDAYDPAAYLLELNDLELAFTFLRRSAQHARAMYIDREGASNAINLARDIARYILVRTTLGALQRRELTQHLTAFRKADEGTQVTALRLVTDFGWIRAVEDAGTYRKPHPTRFEVNPAVAPKFAALAEEERARRALIVQRIAEHRA